VIGVDWQTFSLVEGRFALNLSTLNLSRARANVVAARHPIPNGAGLGVSIWGLTRQLVTPGTRRRCVGVAVPAKQTTVQLRRAGNQVCWNFQVQIE